MMNMTNKGRVFIKRWAVTSGDPNGLVNFLSSPYTVTGVISQMHYEDYLTIFGIPLSPEVVYEIRAKATVKPYTRKATVEA